MAALQPFMSILSGSACRPGWRSQGRRNQYSKRVINGFCCKFRKGADRGIDVGTREADTQALTDQEVLTLPVIMS